MQISEQNVTQEMPENIGSNYMLQNSCSYVELVKEARITTIRLSGLNSSFGSWLALNAIKTC